MGIFQCIVYVNPNFMFIENSKVQQQHEEAMKEVNQGMARSIKCGKDIKRLTDERDAALQEYTLVMVFRLTQDGVFSVLTRRTFCINSFQSERDSVHRELEKLTDDLSQSKKQIKSLETQNKELLDKLQGTPVLWPFPKSFKTALIISHFSMLAFIIFGQIVVMW